jgi:hypothetical protein
MRYADRDRACETITHNPERLVITWHWQTKRIANTRIARPRSFIKLKFINNFCSSCKTLADQVTRNPRYHCIEADELNLERKVRLLENQKDQPRHRRSENVSSVPGRRQHGRLINWLRRPWSHNYRLLAHPKSPCSTNLWIYIQQRLSRHLGRRRDGVYYEGRSVEYEAYYKRADDTFHKIFVNNTFGHVCDVCDRIWSKLDLSLITISQVAVLEEEFANERDRLPTFKLCSTCR